MDFLNGITKLQQRPKCDDWGTQHQHLCRSFWNSLEESTSTDALRAFAKLPLDHDSFALARLVIPELRGDLNLRLTNVSKQYVLDATTDLRELTIDRNSFTQESFDDELFIAEKDIFLDVEIHRARILLHDSKALNSATAKEIREWLDLRPGRKRLQRSEERSCECIAVMFACARSNIDRSETRNRTAK